MFNTESEAQSLFDARIGWKLSSKNNSDLYLKRSGFLAFLIMLLDYLEITDFLILLEILNFQRLKPFDFQVISSAKIGFPRMS